VQHLPSPPDSHCEFDVAKNCVKIFAELGYVIELDRNDKSVRIFQSDTTLTAEETHISIEKLKPKRSAIALSDITNRAAGHNAAQKISKVSPPSFSDLTAEKSTTPATSHQKKLSRRRCG
jgi:hypothetical protein